MRILIADSQRKVRRALRVLLEQVDQVQVAGEAVDSPGLFARIVTEEADLVLLDGDLPGMPMVELVSTLRRVFPEVQTIVLSIQPEHGPAALAAGAHAFVSKGDPAEQLLTAIDRCRPLVKGQCGGTGP